VPPGSPQKDHRTERTTPRGARLALPIEPAWKPLSRGPATDVSVLAAARSANNLNHDLNLINATGADRARLLWIGSKSCGEELTGSFFPDLIEEVGTEGGHVTSALLGPTHTLTFEALTGDVEVGALDGGARNPQTASPIGRVAAIPARRRPRDAPPRLSAARAPARQEVSRFLCN